MAEASQHDDLAEELNSKDIEEHRKGIKANSATHTLKLEAARKAMLVREQQERLKSEANLAQKLKETVAELKGGRVRAARRTEWAPGCSRARSVRGAPE